MRRTVSALVVATLLGCVLPAIGQEVPDGTAASAESAATAAEVFPEVTVTEEMREHQRWRDVLYFVGTAYAVLAFLAILAFGVSRRLRDWAAGVTRQPFLQAMVYVAAFFVVLTAITLPLDWVSGYWVPHRFDLTEQGLGGWLWDAVKGLLVTIVLGAPLVALVLGGIRRVRRWWFAVWLGSVPVILFLVLIGPVVLDPVFNEFKPLEDQALRQELFDLASRAGIQGGRVYQVDKSKQTKTMNAYVNGIGPSKRIVLWDTILAKMDNDELLFVMAHEMGHYVLHHIWKGLAFLLTLMLGVFWVGQRVVEWATRRWGRSWGFATPDDPATVPLLLLVVTLGFFLLAPVFNLYSRSIEHQSDRFALELTHLNHAGARAFVKFAEDSKVVPDPNPFIRLWRYSHPTVAERIELCRTYHPWETGEPDRVWRAEKRGR